MKVRELIDQLKLFDDEGFSDIKIDGNIRIHLRSSASAREIFGEYVEGNLGDQRAVLIDLA